MSSKDLPQDSEPLTPWEYWRESVAAWSDFSQRATKIVASQFDQSGAKSGQNMGTDEETLAGELLRTLSDLNLRHWQNTARLMEGTPAWMQLPNTMAGSALVDWFDTVQRNTPTLPTAPTASPSEGAAPPRLLAPDGPADDLTCIKGIGPKRADKLNALGIFHFTQIAGWTDAEARWVDDQLAIPGRVLRERWIDQAQLLLTGGDETRH